MIFVSRYLRYTSMSTTARQQSRLVAHFVVKLDGVGFDPYDGDPLWPTWLASAEWFVPLCYHRTGNTLIGVPVDLFAKPSVMCGKCLQVRKGQHTLPAVLHEYGTYQETVHLVTGAVTNVWDRHLHGLRIVPENGPARLSPDAPRRAYAETR